MQLMSNVYSRVREGGSRTISVSLGDTCFSGSALPNDYMHSEDESEDNSIVWFRKLWSLSIPDNETMDSFDSDEEGTATPPTNQKLTDMKAREVFKASAIRQSYIDQFTAQLKETLYVFINDSSVLD